MDDYTSNAVSSVDVMDAFHHDRLGPSPSSLSPLNAGEWDMKNIGDNISSNNLETEPFLALGWTGFGDSPPTTHFTAAQTLFDDTIYPDSPLITHDDTKGHDCSREAYDLLGNLSFLSLHKAYSATTTTTPSPNGFVSRVPLDFILHINREASERLNRLLNCSCASHPHLSFLHASIISRILLWYSREAGCAQLSAAWSPASDTALRPGVVSPPPSSIFRPLCGSPSSRLSVATSASSSSMPPGTRATTPDLAPTQMTMGCFSIDDQRVQTALRIQLLLGEMKRIGSLIDTFNAHSSAGALDESTSGNMDTLYKSLGSWLGGEHSSIVAMMRSRLREVGI